MDKKGRTYYANINTKQSSWTWPADVPKPEAGDVKSPSAAKDSSSILPKTSSSRGGGGGSGGISADISYAALRRNAADLAARKRRVKEIFSVDGLDKCEALDESRRIDRKAFAAKHFDISEGGLFSKKDDVTTLLRWSSKALKKPLLRAVHETKSKKAYEDSCQYMRNIQGYMLDRKSGKSEIDHVRKICGTALKYQDVGKGDDASSLRTIMWDELYVIIVLSLSLFHIINQLIIIPTTQTQILPTHETNVQRTSRRYCGSCEQSGTRMEAVSLYCRCTSTQ